MLTFILSKVKKKAVLSICVQPTVSLEPCKNYKQEEPVPPVNQSGVFLPQPAVKPLTLSDFLSLTRSVNEENKERSAEERKAQIEAEREEDLRKISNLIYRSMS